MLPGQALYFSIQSFDSFCLLLIPSLVCGAWQPVLIPVVVWDNFSKFAVPIFPIEARRDWFQRVPVFGNLAILNSVQVVIRSGALSERAFAHNQNKITF